MCVNYNMSATVTYTPQDVGLNISRTVDGLVKWHRLRPADLAGFLGMASATYYRRIADGNWSAEQAAAIQAYFGIRDADALHAGRVLPADTHVGADEQVCMNSVAMTFLPA